MAGWLEKLVCLTAARLPFIKAAPLPVNAAVIDGGKVSDHHAVIPTVLAGAARETLPDAERAVLDMIIARLVCAVSAPHVYETVTVVLECGGHRFSAKGKTVITDGWKAIDAALRVFLKTKPDEGDETGEETGEESALPELAEGQVFPAVAASVREGKTRPPARYTDGALLRAMETAGVEEFDPDTERKGLGTPATRAGIIEKLIKSGFVLRRRKLLIPAELGRNLIAALPADIKTPLLTADWEAGLLEIQRGKLEAADFMAGIAALTRKLVATCAAPIPALTPLFAPPKGVIGKCPRCGADVVERSKGFFCSSRACRFALWKDSRFWAAKGKTLDKKTAAALLGEKRVFFSDLKSEKTGKTYAAAILLEDDGEKTNFKLDFARGRKTA
jgi:DNA topoisomerase-3